MIHKPLRKLLFRDNNPNNILFGFDCVDGRAKWSDSTNILSLKFQVSCDVEERDKLNNLEIGASFSALEIVIGEDNELFQKVLFSKFIIKKMELRSFTMKDFNSPTIARYFIEGEALNSSISESNQ